MPIAAPDSPLRTALLAQLLGGLVAIGLIALIAPQILGHAMALALLQGVCAALTSYKLGAQPWWQPIHLAFMPLVVKASELAISPEWYLGAFLALVVVYWGVAQSKVPLYLSNDQTAVAVAELLPTHACKVIDLGCGNGAFIKRLAGLRPDCQFVGTEYAPLLWLWARLASHGVKNCRITYGSLWRESLSGYDVAYAFLSPVPMSGLWAKAHAEMVPGSLLISNTFTVPERDPDRIVPVADRRETLLYCYRPDSRT